MLEAPPVRKVHSEWCMVHGLPFSAQCPVPSAQCPMPISLRNTVHLGISLRLGNDVVDMTHRPSLAGKRQAARGFLAVAPRIVIEFTVQRHAYGNWRDKR